MALIRDQIDYSLTQHEEQSRSISYSAIADYLTCHRMYYWKRIRNLAVSDRSLPMQFGSVFHKVLANYYAQDDEKGLEKPIFEDTEYEFLPEKGEKSVTHLVELAHAYHEKWRNLDDFSPLTMGAGKLIELGAKIPLKPGWILSAKLDIIVTYKDKIWLVDHKTTGKDMGKSTMPTLQRDIYIVVANWAGIKIFGFIENQIVITKKPKFLRFPVMISVGSFSTSPLDELDQITNEIDKLLSEPFNKEKPHLNWLRDTKQCNMSGTCAYTALCHASNPEPLVTNFKQQEKDSHFDDLFVLEAKDSEAYLIA